MTLDDFVDLRRRTWDLDAVEPTSYYFPEPPTPEDRRGRSAATRSCTASSNLRHRDPQHLHPSAGTASRDKEIDARQAVELDLAAELARAHHPHLAFRRRSAEGDAPRRDARQLVHRVRSQGGLLRTMPRRAASSSPSRTTAASSPQPGQHAGAGHVLPGTSARGARFLGSRRSRHSRAISPTSNAPRPLALPTCRRSDGWPRLTRPPGGGWTPSPRGPGSPSSPRRRRAAGTRWGLPTARSDRTPSDPLTTARRTRSGGSC